MDMTGVVVQSPLNEQARVLYPQGSTLEQQHPTYCEQVRLCSVSNGQAPHFADRLVFCVQWTSTGKAEMECQVGEPTKATDSNPSLWYQDRSLVQAHQAS